MTTPLRVLLLADEAGGDLLLRELRRGDAVVHCARVATVAALRQALEGPVWDVVLYEQGGLPFDVRGVLACIGRAGLTLPVVVATGHSGADGDAAAGLKAGVRGYVSQAQLSRLTPVVFQACRDAEVERQRRLAEQQLHLSEETIAALSQGILVADAQAPDYPIRYVNKAFVRFMGGTADDLLGRGLGELPLAGALAADDLRTALREARPVEAEWRHVRADGGACWLGLTLKPMRDERDRPTQFMAVVTDLSGRKSLEEQLRQAQKMEAVGRLAGGVAHAFDNLFSAIRDNSARLLRETAPDSPAHQDLLRIVEAGARAEKLARRLLQGGSDCPREPKVLDLNALVEDTLRLLRSQVGDVFLTLEATAPVRADAGGLRQLLANLMLFSPDGSPCGGRLNVRTSEVFAGDAARSTRHPAAEGYVQLEMTYGPGGPTRAIPPPGNGTHFASNGPGQTAAGGLAVVRELAAQMGGTVELADRNGSGSAVRVFFPRAVWPLTVAGVVD